MSRIVKYIAILFWVLGITPLLAQKTPDELAQNMYRAIKAENIRAVGTYLATPDEMLVHQKKLGYTYNQEQADDFKAKQALVDTAFLDQTGLVIKEGKSRGIVWAKTEFVKVKSEVETYILSSLDESKTDDFGPVSVIFSHGADKFILTFDMAFEVNGRWRISGDNIKLRTYKDE